MADLQIVYLLHLPKLVYCLFACHGAFASSYSRQPRSLTAKPCKKLHCSLFDRRARRPTYGRFKFFNRIRQDLAKDRIVSFEDFRKPRVNGVALQSNGLVGLPTGKQLQLQPESLNFDGRERVQHEARLRPALLRPAKLGIILVNRRRRGICTEGVPTNFEDAAE